MSTILDSVLPEYQRISLAPDGSTLDEMTDLQRIEEVNKKYKAINENGDVYLVQNPAVWSYAKRILPVLKVTAAEARKGTAAKRTHNSRGREWDDGGQSPWNEEDTEKVRHISRAARRRDHHDESF